MTEIIDILNHPFSPVFNKNSRIIILGSFPSAKSREFGFYYSHPQNRFWKIIAFLTKTEKVPNSIVSKKEMLIKHKIALWDIVKSCGINGSSDNSIINVTSVDLSMIFENSNIEQVFANGGKAYELCKQNSIDAIKLPSTSSANARYNFQNLVVEWMAINKYIL